MVNRLIWVFINYPGVYDPRGHKYIVDCEYEPVWTLLYRVGGVVLKKELIMVHNEAQVMIRYTLVDAHSDTLLRLKPFLAYRNVHDLSKANMWPIRNTNRLLTG